MHDMCTEMRISLNLPLIQGRKATKGSMKPYMVRNVIVAIYTIS